jgi:hypothetical protein
VVASQTVGAPSAVPWSTRTQFAHWVAEEAGTVPVQDDCFDAVRRAERTVGIPERICQRTAPVSGATPRGLGRACVRRCPTLERMCAVPHLPPGVMAAMTRTPGCGLRSLCGGLARTQSPSVGRGLVAPTDTPAGCSQPDGNKMEMSCPWLVLATIKVCERSPRARGCDEGQAHKGSLGLFSGGFK